MDKKIVGSIAKNNIYGQRDDYLIRSFLMLGGDAAFYVPSTSAGMTIVLGRSSRALYAFVVKRVELDPNSSLTKKQQIHALDQAPPPAPTEAEVAELQRYIHVAKLGVVVDKTYAEKVKWFDLEGATIKSF